MPILRPSRRDILKLTAAAPAFVLGAPALAQVSAPSDGQSPGYFRFTVGAAKLTVVSDGYFSGSARNIAINASEDEIADFMVSHYQDATSHYEHTNHVVIELGESTVLVDVGSGHRFLVGGRLSDQGPRCECRF